MRLSRPCYDKPHRCPGWAGGGMRYAKVDRCDNGRVSGLYEKRAWKWHFNRCDTCDVLVLPFAVQYVDPRFWSYAARSAVRDIRYRWVRRGS